MMILIIVIFLAFSGVKLTITDGLLLFKFNGILLLWALVILWWWWKVVFYCMMLLITAVSYLKLWIGGILILKKSFIPGYSL